MGLGKWGSENGVRFCCGFGIGYIINDIINAGHKSGLVAFLRSPLPFVGILEPEQACNYGGIGLISLPQFRHLREKLLLELMRGIFLK